MSKLLSLTAAVLVLVGAACSKNEPAPTPAPSASASDTAMASSPSSSAASAPSTAPSATASAPVVPHDCPKGSTGDGTFDKPCEATGKARMMDVAWTSKIDDKGPYFRVTNRSTLTILHGRIAVYFYDKAGKQLDVPDDSVTPPKTVPYRTCSGNIFSGVMKAGEKAVLTFSCVAKKHVPEGTTAIEAEMQEVGFADTTEKKSDFYWRNKDLTPDARKKGTK